jgi:endonuclease/exonuclease/phosphatase (EEP) superfamily protein YafD
MFLLNSLAVYLFVPLPLVLILAVWKRRNELWVGFAAVFAVGLFFFGELYIPKSLRDSSGTTLTVMTSNILGFNQQTDQVVASILSADADVVALQELSPQMAEVLQRDLLDEYPYQVLNPKEGVAGMGAISRYPIKQTSRSLPGSWVGTPQVLDLSLEGKIVTLINFHAIPPGTPAPEVLNRTTPIREQQARDLVALVESLPGPYILLGDLNSVSLSTAYATISERLVDAWRAGGWGLGHTFPGAVSRGSSRPAIGGIPVPMWLVRIDYIFHSEDWRTLDAWIGPWDGISDHRPVVARLEWVQGTE